MTATSSNPARECQPVTTGLYRRILRWIIGERRLKKWAVEVLFAFHKYREEPRR